MRRCVVVFGVLLAAALTNSDSSDPFSNQPRIVLQEGNLVLKSADGHNVSLSSGNRGHVNINEIDMNVVLTSVRNGGSTQPSNSLQRWMTTFLQQWKGNVDMQLSSLEDNITVISNRVNQFVGSGQDTLSNRRLRRFMGKVQMLTDKVNRLTQLLTENECSSNPCRNGGTCVDGYNGYICNCPTNWEGPTCESDVNECSVFAGTSFGCQNGATCHNSPGAYRCECTTNWHGVHCTEKHDDCSTASHLELCGHGYCIDEKRVQPGQPKYRCICDAGWRAGSNGPACTEDVDECAGNQIRCSQNPPVACQNFPGSFHCGPCPSGYTGNGMSCSDINECETNNGGCSMHPMVACSNTVGSRSCGPCPAGYVGNGVYCSFVGVCAINRGGCSPMATCIENTAITGTYRECRCPAGYTGSGEGLTGCMATTGMSCANNPCHQGTCQMAGGTFQCSCHPGYYGTLCDQRLDPCMSSPCLNGGTCVSSQGSFSCVCMDPYEGPTCSGQKPTCNAFLNENNGTLKYPPEIGQQYRHGENCIWIITVDEHKVINITVNHIHIESSANCEYDFLQFNDGPSLLSLLLGRFCGSSASPRFNFTSTHNQLHIWFKSDSSVASTGFEFTWNATNPICGGALEVADYGAVNSPGYPGLYPRNRNCSWLVQVPIGKRIQFHFATLRLEHHENCSFDYLMLYDGASVNDPVLHTYCTTEAPPPVSTSGHAALLYFHSDATVEDNGFHITYAAIPGIQGCGGELTSPTGTISSPNFPDTYENQLSCEWLIRIHPNNRLLITFSDFHLESHRACNFDSVEIFDGTSETAPLLGRYCGTNVPPPIMSNSHQVYVRFKTDATVRHPGFRAQYRTVCGGVFTELNGSLQSPYFPDRYPAEALCMYDIRLPLGYLINITFHSFQLESHYDCEFDYLQVQDGGAEDSSTLQKLCGPTLPDNFVSSYNQLSFKFVTDRSIQTQGFYLEYEAVEVGCGGVLTEDNGQICSPMHPDMYPHSITCTWLIKAPPGYIIRLTFDAFQIEAHAQCSYDYVLVQDSNGAQIGRYCNSNEPPVLTTTGNTLFVKFGADASVAREGFVASYTFLDAAESCGGDFYLDSGVLRSPGYPTHYPANLKCVWRLHAQAGRQLTLNVTAFQLEQHVDCRFDFLEIRNGEYDSSPVIGRFCGEVIRRSITSHSHVIRLEFKTDGSQSGSGFEIYYDATTTGCGGTLKQPRGIITSPNYPQSYSSNADCKWLVKTSEGSTISLSIVDLDIESHQDCRFDYLQVFDGASENDKSLMRVCNNQQIHGPTLSKGSSMLLRFRSDFSESGRGFQVAYQTICNNVLTKRRGVIESPNFPNSYPHNHNCTWVIQAPAGNNVTIAFSHIYMEGGFLPSCNADYVEVLEIQKNGERKSLAKYCGTPANLPPVIETTTNMAVVQLVTDASVSREGFRLEYAAKGCGGEIRDRAYGVLTSPNFPNGYPFTTSCYWHIWYPPGSRVELRIQDLDMEKSDKCIFDYLRVYAGEDEHGPEILNICHLTAPQTITSHGNEIVVHFFSDVSLAGQGFRASFSRLASGCGGRFTAASAVIMSPNYPSAYDPSSDCSWLIEVDPDHLVVLDFYDFNMPEGINCSHGHVAIYDGDNSSAPLLMNRCGATKPEGSILATGHQMLVKLTADGTNVANGFKAHYKTGCGRRLLADTGGEIASPDYPHSLTEHYNCSWIISASDPGEKVILQITHLRIVPSENCSQSTVRVMDGDLPDSPLIAQFCESRTPPAIVSRGNSLHVNLTSVIFRATYGIVSSHCSGSFSSPQGTFTTPGYPYNYPLGAECVWTITASAGNQVLLSFQSFQLEESDHCNLDYVEVHEDDSAGRLIGRYCGNRIPNNITASHRIWMKFGSDGEGTEAGFIAHYEVVHGSMLNGTGGFIESPAYPHKLYEKGLYEWTVTVPFGLFVSMRFLRIAIDTIAESESCISAVKAFDGLDDTSPELGTFCGYEVPEPVVSVGNVMFIRYISEGYGLWRLQWSAVNHSAVEVGPPPSTEDTTTPSCWHEFELNATNEVSIDSPNYPIQYASFLNCTYIIRGPYYEQLLINFLDIELEDASNCIFDKIQVFILPNPAVDDWQLNQTMCGRLNATTLRSPNNMLKVVFTTDGSANLKGFHSVVTSVCGGQISGTHGVLSSSHVLPHIRVPFRSLTCEWVISVRSRRTIQLSFDSFLVPSDGVCSSNYMMLRNGENANSPLIQNGRYCGSTLPTIPETSTNKAYVKLTVNSVAQGTPQFFLQFRELSLGCGQTYFIDDDNRQVVLQSPNYPSPPPHDLECVWVVMSPPGTRMRVDFEEEFHMSANCYYGDTVEYVELRDGGTELSPVLNRFCGHDQPSSRMTTGNALYFTYVTSVEHPEAGFKATIRTAECGGTVSGFNLAIQSPNYPLNYGSSQECEWILKMRSGVHLSLTILDLDTPPSDNCTLTDYIEVRHYDSQGEVVGLYCGQLVNETIQVPITGYQAYVKFKSNSAINGKGFKMMMQMKPDGCNDGIPLSSPSGVLTSPNYPQASPGKRECFWRISAPEGRRVTITFNELNLQRDEVSGICLSYIQLYNTSYWSSNQRIGRMFCGNQNPGIVDSSSSTMFVHFFTTGIAAGQGFSLSYSTDNEAICGGELQLPSGTFETPYFEPYEDNWVECKWKTTPEILNQTVSFTFDVFDLPGKMSNYCTGGVLIIARIPSGNFYGRMCGNFTNTNMMISNPAPFTSLKMIANVNRPIGGIRGTYNVSNCGGNLDVSNAVIMSPGYPNNYPASTTCHWTITGPPGEEIKLTFVDMRLEDNCEKDYVMIRNGDRKNSPIMGKFCGTHLPVPITSNRNMLSIIFHTDEYGTAPGFKMTTSEVQRGCSGLIHSKHGILTSPNYPQHYGANVECVWTIEYPHGFLVNLTFVGRFDIEMDNTCSKDYLLIEKYDGVSWSEVGKKCGRETPKPIISDTRTMRVTFRSDFEISGDGFQIEYTAKCGGHFNEQKGELRSPNHPHEYDDQLNCEYVVGQPGHSVSIEFDPDQFNIEYQSNCNYDWVELFEGNTTSAPSLGKFCGDTPPDPRTILGPVLVNFVTDYIYVAHGFLARYEIIACGAVLEEPAGIITSTHTSSDEYQNNMDCKWHIIGQPNKIVALKFKFFEVQPSSGCYEDWLMIRDGNETGPVIASLCGYKLPDIFKSTGNHMFLHFRTNYYWTSKGFSVGYYSTLGPQHGCGGTVTAASGEFTSVDTDSDGLYEPKLDCTWYIIGTSSDQVLKIEFPRFDLEASENNTCRYDYVEIRDDMEIKTALVGRYCGNTKPDTVIMSGNKATVHFHSDNKVNKPGFKIKFSTIPSPCGPSTLVVTTTSQTLASPNYPNPYPANLRCRWNFVINGSETDRVNVSITDLDIPCTGDYLEVSKNLDNQYYFSPNTMRMCGPTYSRELLFEKRFFLAFHSDADSIGARGFSLTYKLDECNRTFVGLDGNIVSPGFPNRYDTREQSDAGLHCSMTIVARPGQTISLYFEYFYLTRNPRDTECLNSGIRIHDGLNTSSPLLKTLCGQTYQFQMVASTGHILYLHALTPQSQSVYFITYTTTFQGRGCGGQFTQERGMLASPLYPIPYNQSSECTWLISVPGYHAVQLRFGPILLTPTDDCENYLEIFEGSRDIPEKRVNQLCGTDYAAPFTSQGNQVLLKLVTSSSNQGAGFLAYYEAVTLEESFESVVQGGTTPDSAVIH